MSEKFLTPARQIDFVQWQKCECDCETFRVGEVVCTTGDALEGELHLCCTKCGAAWNLGVFPDLEAVPSEL